MNGRAMGTVLLLMASVAGLAAGASHAQEARALAAPLGTSFTYQGWLTDLSGPVAGTCDFAFKLYDAAGGGSLLGSQSRNNVAVAAGYFTVQLDFGAEAFAGEARWLEIDVDCGSGPMTLSPRQALTAAPYALYALDAPDTLEGLACEVGQTAEWDGSTWVCGSGGSWALTGNAGTMPDSHFLGTTDNNALELRVNGRQILRLEPHITSPNLIGGYDGNSVTAGVYGATIAGGGFGDRPNRVTDAYGTVDGGRGNQAGDNDSAIDDAVGATVGGGANNTASGEFATVGAGLENTASGGHATVSGGHGNIASDAAATVGGGQDNTASSMYATVGGGRDNIASASDTTIGGGAGHTASGMYATVGGGRDNTASASDTTIGGGAGHTASGMYATVGGGYSNVAPGYIGTVGGGHGNVASGYVATVPGGLSNAATGAYSFAAGRDSTATGDHSLAAGRQAKALHNGAFVWADSTNGDFASTAPNQFLVRAYDGVKIVRGASTFTPTSAALQVDQAAAAEAGWFYTAHSDNQSAVLRVGKAAAAPGNFIEGWEQNGTGETRKFHIDKDGTYHAGADFAEALPTASDPTAYEPGDVLVISTAQPGAVDKSRQPYDGLVLGVYSTRPGFLGASEGGATGVAADEVPVAVLGIVPVKVTAENGPIRPGDLLTTSSTPGHAMRCEGLEQCFGRTLGKALEGLPAGQATGVLQVLVSLQ